MKKRIFQILLAIIIFMVSNVIASLYGNYFRRLVRYFFQYSTDGNITFIGKNFHLFESAEFGISFGLFSIFVFYTFKEFNSQRKIMSGIIIFLLFIVSTFIMCYFESNSRIIECTACDDGKLNINYNSINYDSIFITSLVISVFPFLINYIRAFVAKK